MKSNKAATKQTKQTNKTDSEIEHGISRILSYYRERVEAFEKDRQQWYSKLD